MATLRELREAAGLTVEQLAAKAGATARVVVAWEAGTAPPTPHQVGLLALALGVTPQTVQAALPSQRVNAESA